MWYGGSVKIRTRRDPVARAPVPRSLAAGALALIVLAAAAALAGLQEMLAAERFATAAQQQEIVALYRRARSFYEAKLTAHGFR